ncbi:MAG: hypothetical protein QOE70_720 [Chthoniobacter sp.]|jgi:3-methyladenine DNA glycosylase/8-oxoguanine DNA glycosylase|nr:hypothetical protein [Chthoniobacter sp.]
MGKIAADRLPILAPELKAIIRSHGWFQLRPYGTDGNSFLRYAFNLPEGSCAFIIRARKHAVTLSILRGPRNLATRIAHRILSLGYDTEAFYRSVGRQGQFKWIAAGKHGRWLRSASLYEDLFKIILTTNTVWERTEAMNNRAVQLFGETIGPIRAFPTPERIASLTDTELRRELGCGYRAPFLVELARRAVLQPRVFLSDETDAWEPDAFRALLLSIKGIGAVSANYVSRMYGRSLGFAVDAFVLRRCRELWGTNHTSVHRFLERRFGRFEPFGALLLWLELTRHWHAPPSLSPDEF